jgi:hypothetical protein
MASKKELEDRIARLEAELAILKAQRPIRVLPRPSDVPWPYGPWDRRYPQVWCGTSTSGGFGHLSFNQAA